jgi:hypothetical protein
VPDAPVFEYAVVRLVPRVEREEFINVGVVLFCKDRRFLGARILLDEARVAALWPGLDLGEVRQHLEAIPRVCAGEGGGPFAEMDQAERFRWLAAPRSTIIQTSPVHSGSTEDPEAELAHLVKVLVAPVS